MARPHSDENFDRNVVIELRKYGHDVLAAMIRAFGNRGVVCIHGTSV
jgi:hypothetical protein